MRTAWSLLGVLALAALPRSAFAQKVFLNASDQTSNAVSCGGVESTYADDEGKRTQALLIGWGFDVQYSQDFTNSPSIANNWGAEDFLSIHSNAGGGHGTETLYKSSAGQVFAGNVNDALVAALGLPNRGLKYRDNLHMLNATDMPAALTEVLFHDCTTDHATPLGTMSESCFLTNTDGRGISSEAMAKGICAHYGVTCVTGPPPSPLLSMATTIDTITGQERDFEPTDGTFDFYVDQETTFNVDVTNTPEATGAAPNVIVGLSIQAPLEVLEWHIYDNYAGNACGGDWCLNDSDSNASNPSHTSPGNAFELIVSSTSAGETKRIIMRVQGTASSNGAKPEIRAWVRHVDDFYEKAGYDEVPNNVGGLQTWNGGDLKIASAAEVWPPEEEPDAGSGGAPDLSAWNELFPNYGVPGTNDDGGCSCRAASRASGSGAGLALLGAGALTLARRRRRR
jgi:MYXO-CTERM domain-containing protein